MQRSQLPDYLTVELANAALGLACGLFWAGARRFAGHPTPVWQIAFGGVAWLVACQFGISLAARIILSSLTAFIYLAMTCLALARVREALPSRLPLIAVLALHAAVWFGRVPAALLVTPQDGAKIVLTPFFVFIAVEGLFHLIATSILLVTMSKERSENGVQALASTDALTGIGNRRSFLERASRVLSEAARRSQPVSVLMIDIDHFKSINDARGHSGGDVVLQGFGKLLRERIRPPDLCGRLGGEEFACLLADCGSVQASLVAERLRAAVTHAESGVTVSVGVATLPADCAASADIYQLIGIADAALYASKDKGRNRVTVAKAA